MTIGTSQEGSLSPPQEWLQIRANRASKLFEAAAARVRPGFSVGSDPVCFSHWDTYGGSTLDASDLTPETRLIQLVDRVHGNRLADKGSLARLLKAHDCEHLAPATYHSIADALKHAGPPLSVWFLKQVFGTAGKGMLCVANADLAAQILPPHTIVQAEISEPALIDGCKFTSRVYVLLWRGDIWLFADGFTLKHGVPYQPGSVDYTVQIDHRGYERSGAAVRMDRLVAYPAYQTVFPRMRALLTDLRAVLGVCALHTDTDRYLMLGIDLLVRRDGSVQLIEINTAPNFVHSAVINEAVNIPFFTSALRLMLGLEQDGLQLVRA